MGEGPVESAIDRLDGGDGIAHDVVELHVHELRVGQDAAGALLDLLAIDVRVADGQRLRGGRHVDLMAAHPLERSHQVDRRRQRLQGIAVGANDAGIRVDGEERA